MNTTVFYKAVRPDGTDFYSGTILYQTGATVRPKPTKVKIADRGLCDEGVLHAATVPSETLVGGSWPCRLFKVTGNAEYTSVAHPHKKGFRKLVVGDELPAWQVFGPQGEEVVALIDRATRMTGDEARRLSAARDAARVAARDAAWAAAWDAARVAARAAAWDAAWDAAWAAAWAAVGAAAGLVVRDLISTEHFDTLYGPWASVMEVTA